MKYPQLKRLISEVLHYSIIHEDVKSVYLEDLNDDELQNYFTDNPDVEEYYDTMGITPSEDGYDTIEGPNPFKRGTWARYNWEAHNYNNDYKTRVINARRANKLHPELFVWWGDDDDKPETPAARRKREEREWLVRYRIQQEKERKERLKKEKDEPKPISNWDIIKRSEEMQEDNPREFSSSNPYTTKDDPIRYWSWVMQNPEKTEEDKRYGFEWMEEKGIEIEKEKLLEPLPKY